MSNRMDKQQFKRELREAAMKGVSEFLSTTRGSHFAGAGHSILPVGDYSFQIHTRGEGGFHKFDVGVRERWS